MEGGWRVYANGGFCAVPEMMVKTGGSTTELDGGLDLGLGLVFENF